MKDTKKSTKSTQKTSKAKPKVKEKDVVIDENFFDLDDSHDNRLIVFAVIAFLILLAIIVTLIIGCERKEQNEPSKPVNPIVVPEKEEKEDEDEDDGVVTKEIVRKVAAVYTGAKTKEDDTEKESKPKKEEKEESNKENEQTDVYTVTYVFGNETFEEDVNDGDTIEATIPKGYDECTYYYDETHEEIFELGTEITDDLVLYMSCHAIEYTVIYVPDTPSTSNPTNYSLNVFDYTLDPLAVEGFQGWYAKDTYEEEYLVTELNKDIIDYANESDEIYLYAKIVACEGSACDPVTPPDTPTPAPTPGTTDGTSGATSPTSFMLGSSLTQLNIEEDPLMKELDLENKEQFKDSEKEIDLDKKDELEIDKKDELELNKEDELDLDKEKEKDQEQEVNSNLNSTQPVQTDNSLNNEGDKKTVNTDLEEKENKEDPIKKDANKEKQVIVKEVINNSDEKKKPEEIHPIVKEEVKEVAQEEVIETMDEDKGE